MYSKYLICSAIPTEEKIKIFYMKTFSKLFEVRDAPGDRRGLLRGERKSESVIFLWDSNEETSLENDPAPATEGESGCPLILLFKLL